MPPALEYPFCAEARTCIEAVVAGKVAGEFDFGADVEVRYTDVLADVVPELRLGDEDELALLEIGNQAFLAGYQLCPVDDILAPDIGEAAEGQAGDSEEVFQTPYHRKLDGKFALGALAEGLVENLEVEGILEVGAVHEVIYAEQEILVPEINTAVVFYMKAQGSEGRIMPEIQTTGDFHVAAAGEIFRSGLIPAVEIIINEEEGVTPLVIVESLESGREMVTVLPEIVESLEIGLGFCSLSESEGCKGSGDKNFFGHKM